MDRAVLGRFEAPLGAAAGTLMARPAHPLRTEFQALLMRHVDEHGEDFERSALVQDFVDRGVSPATVYRWIEAVLARNGTSSSQRSMASAEPVAPNPADAPIEPDHAPMIVPALPRIPRVEDVKTKGLVPVLELLGDCIQTAKGLIEHARTAEGKVRNARLLLQGSEHLRKAIETAARLNETVAIQQEMQEFHRIVLEEISNEPLAVQARIFQRITQACNNALAN
jgi:hypothetical protein